MSNLQQLTVLAERTIHKEEKVVYLSVQIAQLDHIAQVLAFIQENAIQEHIVWRNHQQQHHAQSDIIVPMALLIKFNVQRDTTANQSEPIYIKNARAEHIVRQAQLVQYLVQKVLMELKIHQIFHKLHNVFHANKGPICKHKEKYNANHALLDILAQEGQINQNQQIKYCIKEKYVRKDFIARKAHGNPKLVHKALTNLMKPRHQWKIASVVIKISLQTKMASRNANHAVIMHLIQVNRIIPVRAKEKIEIFNRKNHIACVRLDFKLLEVMIQVTQVETVNRKYINYVRMVKFIMIKDNALIRTIVRHNAEIQEEA